MNFPLKHGVLQGDMDAAGFTILNLNLAGLSLDKNDVGLGNVDNTSDLNKPVSTAQQAAIFLREPAIAEGTTDQFFIGDKTWLDYGDLALQDGNTTLQELSVIGLNAAGLAFLSARRHDAASSFANVSLGFYGASHAGSILGVSAANAAALGFFNSSTAFVYTNGASPLIFGTNSLRRMRLMTGLNAGGDTDPGAGCLEVADTITADHFEGDDLTLTGDVACQDLACSGSSTFAGAVTTTLGVNVGQNLAVGGNMAVTGAIVNFANLPTADPHVAGSLWRSTNDLKVSTG